MYEQKKERVFEFGGENPLAQSPKIQFALEINIGPRSWLNANR